VRLELLDDLHRAIFGAPLTVPAGKVARTRSNAVVPGLSWPVTVETRCITWE